MKFAHFADCHLGSWRDARLQELNLESFRRAVQVCLDEQVSFVLVCGDLFNTPVPPLDVLRAAITELKRLHDSGIRVFVIPGSHDFSPSGKTIIDVLESAGLCTNVSRGDVTDEGKLRLKFFEHDGVRIAGILGKRGGLDRSYYEELDRSSLDVPGKKIFMFHNTLNELKPEDLPSEDMPLSLLPQGFDYYAGGHVHFRKKESLSGYNVVYPGPTFPNNFAELEKLRSGSMVIVEDFIPRFVDLDVRVVSVSVDGSNLLPSEVETRVAEKLTHEDVKGAVVLIRSKGTLKEGKVTDISWQSLVQNTLKRGALVCLKNSEGLSSPELGVVRTDATADEIEEKLVRDNMQGSLVPEESVKRLLQVLAAEKQEGETQAAFDERVENDLDSLLTSLGILAS